MGREGGGHCPKADCPLSPGNEWDKSFYRQKEGATCRNSTVSGFTLVTDGVARIILTLSGLVNLQVQGPFVPPFLDEFSENCGSLCHGYCLVIM